MKRAAAVGETQMLEVQDVEVGYGATQVVQGVTLQLKQGDIACLLGGSGCGKTTLLRAIGGFEPLRAGRIALNGVEVSAPGHGVSPQKRDIGMVFQDHALFPHLSVEGNVAFGLHRLPAGARPARVAQMLEVVGLQGMGGRWPHELSGGQQQRVALARALAPQPRLLLMDEPFSSLDTSLRESIAREVRAILQRAGATALMVTHDQQEAFAMADHIGVMAQGRLMQWGSAVQVYCQPATRAVAQFVGEGVMLSAQATPAGRWATALGELDAQQAHYGHAGGGAVPAGLAVSAPDANVQVFVRPEQVTLVGHPPADAPGEASAGGGRGVTATVRERIFRGSHWLYRLDLADGQAVLAHAALSRWHEPGEVVPIAVVPAEAQR